MPEYLAPGVYVEEVSFRSKSIEGVPTSTTAFAGVTRYGPVQYTEGPASTRPRLVTSFTEFERVYGGLDPLELASGQRTAYLAHAVRAFFNNGGRRLYISRVFAPLADVDNQVAHLTVSTAAGPVEWRARWPGADGNVHIETRVNRSKNLAFKFEQVDGDPFDKHLWGWQVKSVLGGAVVEVTTTGNTPPIGNAPLVANNLRVVKRDGTTGRQTFLDATGADVGLPNDATLHVALVEMRVTVRGPGSRLDNYEQLAAHADQRRDIAKVLEASDPEDENAIIWLKLGDAPRPSAIHLMAGLQSAGKALLGGKDGDLPSPDNLAGQEADPDDVKKRATGLAALAEIDDIAIVALPDGGAMGDPETIQACADRLITHAESCRYRIAVVDGAEQSSISEIRSFRGRFDSKYAALYHPWIEILDPLFPNVPGVPPRKLVLPPSGFVTGVYARSDIERGVHKAPANEVVRGLTKFEININRARQDVLNPEGVNCLRFFEGRGSRVWGARTMSSDPEWKYVNVRRLFIYIEHSIDKATQWAVFEPNNDRLWGNIRSMVEDFLLVLWRDGALIGDKPEQAYFVRCDRTTMTQNDLDNGRMICLVGVAPSRPAEFVIFRVGQWTADSKA
jgi:phage tail sheath protein FI